MVHGNEALVAGRDAIYLSLVGSDMNHNVRHQNHRGQHQTYSHGSFFSPERRRTDEEDRLRYHNHGL